MGTEREVNKNYQRQALSKALLKDFARIRPQPELPFVTATGESPVIVALGEDLCSQVIARASRTGGANVFVLHRGSVKLLALEPTAPGELPPEGPLERVVAVHEDIRMDMLLDSLLMHPGQEANIRITSGASWIVPHPQRLEPA